MPNPSVASHELARPRVSAPTFDTCAFVACSALIFALTIDPLLEYWATGGLRPPNIMAPRMEPRIFWPAMAVISVLLAVQKRARFRKLSWPPHIVCLFVYLALAGASVLWAFSPDRSFVRFTQQLMVVTSVVLPVLLTARTVDVMRGVFLCFALALVLNMLFVLGGSVTLVQYGAATVDIGYQGYFDGKNYLGECSAPALLLALNEIRYRGGRRVFGVMIAVLAIVLIRLSDSKTALGLAVVVPFLAWFTLTARKITRLSPAIILMCIPFGYLLVSSVSKFNMNRISFMLFGDATLTGRTIIWDFVGREIDRHSLLGWGYQSFWLVPGSPVYTEAPGWVRIMPNAHNGYYDTILETGHVGLVVLLAFVIATLHTIGRVHDRNPARAQLLLSLALFVICWNYFESIWVRGYEFLWVLFIFVVVEIARYWQPLPVRKVVRKSRNQQPRSPGPFPDAQAHPLRVRLS